MSDIETDSEWAHLLGRCMAGSLKGKSLKPIISDMMTWGAWREEFPKTTVLNLSRTSQNYSRDFYDRPSRFVFGFHVGAQAWMLSIETMLGTPVHSFKIEGRSLLATFDREATAMRLLDPKVDDRILQFESTDDGSMMIDKQTQSKWKLTGEAIEGSLAGKRLKQRVGIMSFRRAWLNFHPDAKDAK